MSRPLVNGWMVHVTKHDGTERYIGADGGRGRADPAKLHRLFTKERTAKRLADRLRRKNPSWRIQVAKMESTAPVNPLEWTPFSSTEDPNAFVNSRYHVLVEELPEGHGGGWPAMIHLSIKRHDKASVHDWRDLQRIKNELVGPEHEAVELYPAESRLMDTSNQYHLWVLADAGHNFPFGYEGRAVVAESIQGMTVQRPIENPPSDAMTEDQAREAIRTAEGLRRTGQIDLSPREEDDLKRMADDVERGANASRPPG